MNIKDQLNIIAIHEQSLKLLIKVKVLENILIEKNICTAEEYDKKLNDVADLIAKDLKPVYEQLAKLNEVIKQQATEVENKTTGEDK